MIGLARGGESHSPELSWCFDEVWTIMRPSLTVLLLLFALTGCQTYSSPTIDLLDTPFEKTRRGVVANQETPADPELPVLKTCDAAPLPPMGRSGQWNRIQSRIASALMSPRHVLNDILATGEDDVIIRGKFGHGSVVKDLEHEEVELWFDDCSGSFQKMAVVETDDEGMISYRWPAEDLPPYGMYRVYARVVADGTDTIANFRLLPRGTRLVVYDIDGTLTSGDGEVWKDLIADRLRPVGVNDYVPRLRSGAEEVTRHRAFNEGYISVYLTGRLYWMWQRTRHWMTTSRLAPGHLEMAPDWGSWLPSKGGVGEFKADFLTHLRDQGFEIDIFYGNTRTDSWAYAHDLATTPQIFLFEDGEEIPSGANGRILQEDYRDHLIRLQRQEQGAVEQPFQFSACPNIPAKVCELDLMYSQESRHH